MRVNDVMQRAPQVATPGMSLARAGRLMYEVGCGFLPVVGEESAVVGVITDRDLALALASRDLRPSEVEVRHVMTGDVWSCQSGDLVLAALQTMAERRVRRLPVVDKDGRLRGILSLDDVLLEAPRQAVGSRPSLEMVAETLRAICDHPLPAVR